MKKVEVNLNKTKMEDNYRNSDDLIFKNNESTIRLEKYAMERFKGLKPFSEEEFIGKVKKNEILMYDVKYFLYSKENRKEDKSIEEYEKIYNDKKDIEYLKFLARLEVTGKCLITKYFNLCKELDKKEKTIKQPINYESDFEFLNDDDEFFINK